MKVTPSVVASHVIRARDEAASQSAQRPSVNCAVSVASKTPPTRRAVQKIHFRFGAASVVATRMKSGNTARLSRPIDM